MERLSDKLKQAAENAFAGGMNRLGVQLCEWAVEAEKLETGIVHLENTLARVRVKN